MSRDSLAVCPDCARSGAPLVRADITVHDKRGCLTVCSDHARWRMANSRLFGHSDDCPCEHTSSATSDAFPPNTPLGRRVGIERP